MKNQNIKDYVDDFRPFIENNCILENKSYVFDNNIYKKLFFEQKIQDFLDILKNYYYKNKYYYIEPTNLVYNRFLTIIRQICNKNNIKYEKNIKYIMSKYTVSYSIHFD